MENKAAVHYRSERSNYPLAQALIFVLDHNIRDFNCSTTMKVKPTDSGDIRDDRHQVSLTSRAHIHNISSRNFSSVTRVSKVPRQAHHSSFRIQVSFFLFSVFILTRYFDLESSFIDKKHAISLCYPCNSRTTSKKYSFDRDEICECRRQFGPGQAIEILNYSYFHFL